MPDFRIDLHLASLTVQSGGAVDVGDRGYSAGHGPAVGLSGNPFGLYGNAGSGHGGMGGASHLMTVYKAVPGTTYGIFNQPTNSGSGGTFAGAVNTSSDPFRYNAGGGAVKLQVDGELRVDGVISANAPTNWASFPGPGAGGSIWVVAGALTGNGTLTAHGGTQGATAYSQGGGGGGRIAIDVATNAFSGLVAAYGGTPRAAGNIYNGEYGAAGTIWIRSAAQSNGALTVDNNGKTNWWAVTRLGTAGNTGAYAFDALRLRGHGQLEVCTGETLNVSADVPLVDGDGSGTIVNNGTFGLPETYALTNHNLCNNNGASLGALRDLTIATNCALTHGYNMTAEVNRIEMALRNLTIQPGGRISADGRGYTAYQGPGATPPLSFGPAPGNYCGASHGGIGYSNSVAIGMPPYGNVMAPANLGSGGNYNLTPPMYGFGGGAIHLRVRDTLIVDGAISANGQSGGTVAYPRGCGAGGSIWIETGTLAGSGAIRADGGNSPTNYGGAGGRIAIYYRYATFAGLPEDNLYSARQDMSASVTVRGGFSTNTNGLDDGTVYIRRRGAPGMAVFVW